MHPRPSARQRGYDSRWDKARRTYIAANPLCVMCEKQDRAVPASVVDHIIPHRGDQQLFWDRENWQSLCTSCHSRHKQRQEHGNDLPAIGADGWPIE